MKESGGQLRGDEIAKDGWGWIDITSIATSAGADLKPTLAFIQPDDGNKDDQTVARVDAARAGAAGRVRDAGDGLHVEAAAGVRPHGVQGRLLPRRPVVPEAGRLRAGGHARARDGRVELPPVPRELGVLRRLRHVRRRHHGPERLHRRRHGRAEAASARTATARPRTRTSRPTSTTSRGQPTRTTSSSRRRSRPRRMSRRPNTRARRNCSDGRSTR